MNAIFKSGNVYVISPSKDVRSDIYVDEIQELVYDNIAKSAVCLYGGRVHLDCHNYKSLIMSIDGIEISEIYYESDGKFKTDEIITLQKATAFLNQIENLGVDSFLDNYKIQLQTLKSEIEDSALKLEQELSVQFDENKSAFLENLRTSIHSLSRMIFLLLINLNAGLDNHCYSEAYENITNLYF